MLTGIVVLFIFLLAFSQAENINSLPKGVHQWAQADRYAVAAQYSKGRGFLSPATYCLISDEGAVGVEFPLVQYASGLLARPDRLRPYLPLFYRGLTFLLLILGISRLIRRVFPTNGFWIRMFIGLLAVSSPLLLFYGYNFSPDSAALGLCLLALSYMDRGFRNFFGVLLLLGLAALLKTSSGIYLLAFLGSYVLIRYPKEASEPRKWVGKLAVALAVISLIALYDYHYIHLKNKALWSSIFLSQTHPIPDWASAEAVASLLWRWRMEYHSLVQWILIGYGVFYGLHSLWKGRVSRFHLVLVSLMLLGILSVVYLFGIQFMNHDYYYIATFGPLIILIMLLGIKQLISWRHGWLVVVAAALWSFGEGSNQHFDRNSANCTIKGEHHNFDFAWLEQLRSEVDSLIPNEASVFVVYEMEPNLSLSYMDRMGIVFNEEDMGSQESYFYYWLERRKPEFVLCRTRHLDQFELQHTDFLNSCNAVKETADYRLYRTHGH